MAHVPRCKTGKIKMSRTSTGWYRKDLLIAASVMAAAVASPVWAAQTHSFNIGAQPAQTGVAEFARQADIQILITDEAAANHRTNARFCG